MFPQAKFNHMHTHEIAIFIYPNKLIKVLTSLYPGGICSIWPRQDILNLVICLNKMFK